MTSVLNVKDLHTSFVMPDLTIAALQGVSLSVDKGEILGLVGESGSGKTLTGFSINRLLSAPGRVVQGEVLLHGQDVLSLGEEDMRHLRGRRIAMIFQDPMMTLNPVLRIETQMRDALRAHEKMSKAMARTRAIAALDEVGIPAPESRLRSYPHELSGGMRQRVAIAIALLHQPDVIIADEPTTALDVTIQGQILSLVQNLCRDRGTALIWITHDLAVVAGIADRLAVMYAGRVVEIGPVDDLLDAPAHPYTRGLIDSVPARGQRGQRLKQIPGRMPALTELPVGCSFAPRCEHAKAACAALPDMTALDAERSVRCFYPLAEGSA
ncbi:oligopeptide/dipeptide ABC transporter, ATP-binding protein, C-terminal domain-containing protein [Monaibacterium marinum]|uniref:Oligopeptide/dipeptide ABC transporter, ATP-binding protein, C-terminal domain-containing protein n=1 Tax=Pontivivens marinum TaxID=1690039 RepID=A0A2C9CWG7_9RHOB|nr:ABC transporter ATP-binding protein [Monaibacterium marinum]SOH95612.1 oligopeptide/dipeptide ABC transporter, ATP-binding protein, C-terminal domain-containing protein [Monaibacterium marinum]